jgi:hypothetical protein
VSTSAFKLFTVFFCAFSSRPTRIGMLPLAMETPMTEPTLSKLSYIIMTLERTRKPTIPPPSSCNPPRYGMFKCRDYTQVWRYFLPFLEICRYRAGYRLIKTVLIAGKSAPLDPFLNSGTHGRTARQHPCVWLRWRRTVCCFHFTSLVVPPCPIMTVI